MLFLLRLNFTQSKTDLIRQSSEALLKQVPNLSVLGEKYKQFFTIAGKKYFLYVSPYHDQFGLQWLTAIIIPEADFMSQITVNRNNTIWLCFITLIISIGIGMLTANWVIVPITRLNTAAKQIAEGSWDDTWRAAIDIKRTDELGQLGRSFEEMAKHLKEDFSTLERRVKARTIELDEANQLLQELASLDGLTCIANRRSFDQRLDLEWQRLSREQQPLSLIFLDIDFFKLYNDKYGHQQGDLCLIQIAKALDLAVNRSTDLAARYGGEEFTVILPNTDTNGAIKIATKIQDSIAALNLPHKESVIKPYVTVSMGICTLLPSLETSPELLIASADRGLYQAKESGRNRYMVEQARL